MRLQTTQIVAGLLCLVAFAIAFMAAGAAIISSIFALIGAGILAWLVYTLARRALSHRAARNASTG